MRLQPKNPADRRAYVITSVDASEGKTSLAAALGLSFAAAGFRTVVIDADLASRQLTLNFDAEESPGLVEAAANTEPAIRRVRGGLSVLTAGSCRPQDAFRLAPAAVGRLLTSLRERFDVVLIDSDPILTGLAASVIAPHADGVVLALARGQQQARVQSAVRHLQILGAVPAAAVFNRADAGDFHAVLSAQTPGPNRVLPERLNRFGSLVGATLASLPLTREDDMDLMPVGFALAKSDQSGRAEAQNESRRVA